MISRHLLRASLLAILTATAATGFLGAPAAYAQAPMVKTQAPGYYRMMLGDFEVTALSDGTINLPVDKLLMNITPAQVDKDLARHDLKSPLATSVNAYLINTGSKLVLIDTGAGSLFGPALGGLLANLKAAGYQPGQVDEIYITHMHPDHVGGLVHDGKMVFPNAIIRADKREAGYWLNDANVAKAPKDKKDFFKGAMAAVEPYVKAGKFKPFEGDTQLVPGIKAIASPGHTPGHTSYEVESKGQKLLIMGDLIHVGAVQFAHPDVTIHFDSENKEARRSREKIFADAARKGYLVAGAHLSFPGIGHLRVDGKGYRWLPVNYVNLK